MRKSLTFIHRFYGFLLILFPQRYRHDYGDELQTVFELSVEDAIEVGWLEVVKVISRELVGLPKAIIHEHLRERRKTKMTGKFLSRFDFPQGSRMEPWGVMLPYVLTYIFYRSMISLFISISNMPFWVEVVIGLTFLGSIFGMFIAGLRIGAPRWFLPYLGFVLSIINLFTHTLVFPPSWSGFPFLQQASRFIRGFVHQGTVWIGVIVLAILLVLVAALIPKFRPFYRRLRNDWTLLAFVIYGVAPLALMLTFDDYQGEEPYVLTGCLILVIGGWFYLRAQIPWKRYLILFVSLALSMAIAATGKAIIYIYFWEGIRHFTWQSEMMSTVTLWVWLALFMLTPLALNLLPRTKIYSQMPDAVM
jgi:hypothetical protein